MDLRLLKTSVLSKLKNQLPEGEARDMILVELDRRASVLPSGDGQNQADSDLQPVSVAQTGATQSKSAYFNWDDYSKIHPDRIVRKQKTAECIPYYGRIERYQEKAREICNQQIIMPWTWIYTTCNSLCLNPEHMKTELPREIKYPKGVCIYCGLPANSKDHLLPKPFTGNSLRQFVAVVPSCKECNSAINDRLEFSISKRRELAHAHIWKKHRRNLSTPDRAEEELKEYGPRLQSFIRDKQNQRHTTRLRLQWPDDPYYDLRAFEKTGIDRPGLLGLL